MGPINRLAIVASAFVLVVLSHQQQVEAAKIDCYPIAGATKERCEALGCTWSPVKQSQQHIRQGSAEEPSNSLVESDKDEPPKSRVDEPWCHHPADYLGYKVTEMSSSQIKLTRTRPSALGDDVQNLVINLQFYNEGHMARLTIRDADKRRFEPELPELNLKPVCDDGLEKNQQQFSMEVKPKWALVKGAAAAAAAAANQEDPHVLTITRASTGAVVFSTDLGKLIYSDKFLQLNTDLSSPFVFGLGEHYDTFLKMADRFKTYSFWNSDYFPMPGGSHSYGGFPFLINLDSQNQSMAHGLYLRNSNAMDVVLQKDISITFRPIGGLFDFFFFSGPTPLEVTRQFQQLVGLPDLPARWSLGFHLCRYNYNSLAKTRLVWERTREAGIPFDVQWNDLDSFERANGFSYDKNSFAGLPKFVDELHSKNMHYIPLVDPGISQEANYHPYELGTQMDIWMRNATNQTLVGRVWNQSGRTVFPDFSKPASHEYWVQMFAEYYKEVKFDGAWIDMNDISNFVEGSLDGCPSDNPLESPPYLPGGRRLQEHSICLSAQHEAGNEYDVHNLYSFYEAIATKKALQAVRPGRRSLIISRSTHPGQGHYSGHWSGDILANWGYLKWSIPSLLEHSMYGFSMMGADICGFAGNTTPQLCARWSTLGAFYTFSRNHNDDTSIDQDPVALGPEVVAANKNAFTKRYSLLPYLYSLIYKAHKFGEPVARSLSFEFFHQLATGELRPQAEDQFMWGSALMISPVVEENTYKKASFLPKGRWYETDILPESMSFNVSQVKVPKLIDSESRNVKFTDQIALSNMPLFYRGGHIVPVYAQVKSTIPDTEHEQAIALEVALCQEGRAKGDLYMDDGESIEEVTNYLKMEADKGQLQIELVQDDYRKQVEFGKVKVMGVRDPVNRVEVILAAGHKQVPFAQKDHLLILDLTGTSVTKAEPITLSWS